MTNKDKNIVDKFLDSYEDYNNHRVKYKRIIVRPSKFNTVIGFIFSFGFFIILIRFFIVKPFYFIFLIGDILSLIYYSLNLFTKKGFGLPKTVIVEDEEDVLEVGDDSDEYRN